MKKLFLLPIFIIFIACSSDGEEPEMVNQPDDEVVMEEEQEEEEIEMENEEGISLPFELSVIGQTEDDNWVQLNYASEGGEPQQTDLTGELGLGNNRPSVFSRNSFVTLINYDGTNSIRVIRKNVFSNELLSISPFCELEAERLAFFKTVADFSQSDEKIAIETSKVVGFSQGEFKANVFDIPSNSCFEILFPTLFDGDDEISISLSSDLLLAIHSSSGSNPVSLLKIFDINSQELLNERELNPAIASATVDENYLYLFYLPDSSFPTSFEKIDLTTFEVIESGENFLPIGRDTTIRFFEVDFFEGQLVFPEPADSSLFLNSPALLTISTGAILSKKEIVSTLYNELSNSFGCDFRMDLLTTTEDLRYAIYKFPYGRCVTSPSGIFSGVAIFDLEQENVFFFDSNINVNTILANY